MNQLRLHRKLLSGVFSVCYGLCALLCCVYLWREHAGLLFTFFGLACVLSLLAVCLLAVSAGTQRPLAAVGLLLPALLLPGALVLFTRMGAWFFYKGWMLALFAGVCLFALLCPLLWFHHLPQGRTLLLLELTLWFAGFAIAPVYYHLSTDFIFAFPSFALIPACGALVCALLVLFTGKRR